MPVNRHTDPFDATHVPRPCVGLAEEYPPGYVSRLHRHQRGQLLYACAGIMTVVTGAGSWVVPPQRALWLPGGTDHEVHCRDAVSLRTVYVDEAARPGLPPDCRVMEVSALLRALLQAAVLLPLDYDEAGRDGRVMQLVLDEMCSTPATPLHVPMPADPRLARVCRAILHDPASDASLDDWARQAGLAPRSMSRRFQRETGMSFAAWRQHARLVSAIPRLAAGQPVTTVALDVGYDSPSAFTAMFRRAFGVSPTRYFSERMF